MPDLGIQDPPRINRKDVWEVVTKHYWDIILWFGFTVIIGLMPLILTWLIHYLISGVPGPMEKVKQGELMLFVTTLCASSMAMFAEISDPHFPNAKRVMLLIILVIVLLSSATGTIASMITSGKDLGIHSERVIQLSEIIFYVGIASSFVLYILRLTVEKRGRTIAQNVVAGLFQYIRLLTIEEYNFKEEQKKEISKVQEDAKIVLETDSGARL